MTSEWCTMAVKTKRNCGYCGTVFIRVGTIAHHFQTKALCSSRSFFVSSYIGDIKTMSGRKGGMIKEMEALGASTLPPELQTASCYSLLCNDAELLTHAKSVLKVRSHGSNKSS